MRFRCISATPASPDREIRLIREKIVSNVVNYGLTLTGLARGLSDRTNRDK